MLKVRVLFFASYREQAGTGVEMIQLPQESDLGNLIRVVCERHTNIKCPPENIVVAVNEEFRDHSTIITEGDTVALIPPVSGG